MCLGRWHKKPPSFILVLVRLGGAVCLFHDLCPGVWSWGHIEHLYGGIPTSFLRVHVNDNMDWSREFMPRRISRYFLVCCIWWRLDMDFFFVLLALCQGFGVFFVLACMSCQIVCHSSVTKRHLLLRSMHSQIRQKDSHSVEDDDWNQRLSSLTQKISISFMIKLGTDRPVYIIMMVADDLAPNRLQAISNNHDDTWP